ncbi:DUF2769 domain-containing protein [Candidatus Falkowbacteria bacterium]|nr:DUF2769 domain-containing protein [Candidatus Falkowbacteria bacterium]
MVIDNEENSKLCTCPNCPSYDACMKGDQETLYCGRAMSGCEVSPKGCICQSCPVYEENGLTDSYYCINGKA